jgi:hypothetical protein
MKYFWAKDGSFGLERKEVKKDGTCFAHALWEVGSPFTVGKEAMTTSKQRRCTLLDEVYGQGGVGLNSRCRENGEFLGSEELKKLNDGAIYFAFEGGVARSDKLANSYGALALHPMAICCSKGEELDLPCLAGQLLGARRREVGQGGVSTRTRSKKCEEEKDGGEEKKKGWNPKLPEKKYPVFFLIHYAQGTEQGTSQHWEGARLWRRKVGQGGVRKRFYKGNRTAVFERCDVEEVREMTPLEVKELMNKWPLVLPDPNPGKRGQKRALPSIDGGQISE